MTDSRRETPYTKRPRRGALSARALGFAQGDEYTAAAALRDEPGELSPHARRLGVRDQLAGPADGDAIDTPVEIGPVRITRPDC
jgi:hypothetical protein